MENYILDFFEDNIVSLDGNDDVATTTMTSMVLNVQDAEAQSGVSRAVMGAWMAINSVCPIEVNGIRLDQQYNDDAMTFEGLNIFRTNEYDLTFNGVPIDVRISDLGLTDLSLDNFSVRQKNCNIMHGSGKNLLAEVWEKKDGYSFITIELKTATELVYLAVKFDIQERRWRLGKTNCFLMYSGELVGSKHQLLYVKEDSPSVITFEFKKEVQEIPVAVVPRYALTRKTWPIIWSFDEGIVVMVEGMTHRLKKRHTIDLNVISGSAYTKDSRKVFSCSMNLSGIHEFSLEGEYVRPRPDKGTADPYAKFQYYSKMPTLEKLKSYVQLWDDDGGYLPSQHVPYSMIQNVSNELTPAVVSKTIFAQPWSSDQDIGYSAIVLKGTDIILPPLTDFTNSDGFLAYQKYINSYIRAGGGIAYDDFKQYLSKEGVFLDYGRYKVKKRQRGTSTYYGGEKYVVTNFKDMSPLFERFDEPVVFPFVASAAPIPSLTVSKMGPVESYFLLVHDSFLYDKTFLKDWRATIGGEELPKYIDLKREIERSGESPLVERREPFCTMNQLILPTHLYEKSVSYLYTLAYEMRRRGMEVTSLMLRDLFELSPLCTIVGDDVKFGNWLFDGPLPEDSLPPSMILQLKQFGKEKLLQYIDYVGFSFSTYPTGTRISCHFLSNAAPYSKTVLSPFGRETLHVVSMLVEVYSRFTIQNDELMPRRANIYY